MGLSARPRAILFDWDNTLVDTWIVIHQALTTTFTAMGETPWTLAQTKERVRQSAREAFPRLFGDRAEEAADIFYRSFEATHLDLLTELPGAGTMLRRLSDSGCYLGVVSNKKGYLLRREAGHLGWTDLFGRLVGANDADRDKPASDPVRLALEPSGVEPGPSVWFVGDTDIDMLCAVNSGCIPVLLRDRPPGDEEFAPAFPQSYFANCEALADDATGD